MAKPTKYRCTICGKTFRRWVAYAWHNHPLAKDKGYR
jgi:DNA-directed RNA polymerase subunit RPC12/RpoP